MEKIDFVITWVDGKDPIWQIEKNKYMNKSIQEFNTNSRYRDWDNLQYWFRGVEKYAPWVNKIYFVTCGHIPQWLNTDNPKLQIVRHEEIIPQEYLPTFTSTVIELYLYKIKNLSEKFVYFNDDMFIINKVQPRDFFYKEIPCDAAVINPIIPQGKDDVVDHITLNCMDAVNKNFDVKQIMKKNFFKYINIKNGNENIRNFCLLPWPKVPSFKIRHIPNSFVKATFEDVWKKEKNILLKTSENKFRTKDDVSQYIFKFWQLGSAKFHPRKYNIGYYYEIDNNNIQLKNVIKTKKYKLLCINDAKENIDFDKVKDEIKRIFDIKLQEKSSYEL